MVWIAGIGGTWTSAWILFYTSSIADSGVKRIPRQIGCERKRKEARRGMQRKKEEMRLLQRGKENGERHF